MNENIKHIPNVRQLLIFSLQHPRFISGLLLLTMLSTIVLSIILLAFTPLSNDQGWYAHATRQWLGGSRLYLDLFETNPPLIFFFTAPIVWVGEIMDFADVTSTHLYYGVIILLASSLHLYFAYQVVKSRNFLLVYSTLLTFIMFILPFRHFGQRDHIAVAFMLPYFFSRYFDVNGKQTLFILKIITGLLLGLAASFKPYFLIFPLITELWVFSETKKRRNLFSWQLFTAGTVMVLFSLYLAYSPAYLVHILPMVQATYWTFGYPVSMLMVIKIFLLQLITLTSTLGIKNHNARRLVSLLTLLSMAGLVSYLLQRHYWYHTFPLSMLISISWIWLGYFYARQHIYFKKAFLPGTISLAVISVGLLIQHTLQLAPALSDMANKKRLPTFTEIGYPAHQKTIEILNARFDNQTVYFFSVKADFFNFVTDYSGLKWVSGYYHHWPIPAIAFAQEHPDLLNPKKEAAIKSVRQKAINQIRNEVLTYQPQVIFVDTLPPDNITTPFNYPRFIQSNPQLAQLFDSYLKTDLKLPTLQGVEVWIRKDANSPPGASTKWPDTI